MSTLIEALKRAEALRKLNRQNEAGMVSSSSQGPQLTAAALPVSDNEVALIDEETRMAAMKLASAHENEKVDAARLVAEQQRFAAIDNLSEQRKAIDNETAAKRVMREAAEAKVSAAISARTIEEAAALSAANERLAVEVESLRITLERKAAESALAEVTTTNIAHEREFAKLTRERAAAEGAATQAAIAAKVALSEAQEKLLRDIADLTATRDAAIAEKAAIEKARVQALHVISRQQEQNRQAAADAIDALNKSNEIKLTEAAKASQAREALQAALDGETHARIAATEAASASAVNQKNVEDALASALREKIVYEAATKALAISEGKAANTAALAAQAEIEQLAEQITAQETQALELTKALEVSTQATHVADQARIAKLAERKAAAAKQIEQISQATAAREAAEAALAQGIAAADAADEIAAAATRQRLDAETALKNAAIERTIKEKSLAAQKIAYAKNERDAAEAALGLIRVEATLRETIEAKLVVIEDANQLAIAHANRDKDAAAVLAAPEAIKTGSRKASTDDVNHMRAVTLTAGVKNSGNGNGNRNHNSHAKAQTTTNAYTNPLMTSKLPPPKPVSRHNFWSRPLKFALVVVGFVGLGFVAGNKISNDASLRDKTQADSRGLKLDQADTVLATAARNQAARELSIANSQANLRGEPLALKLDTALRESPATTSVASTANTPTTITPIAPAKAKPEPLKK